jgi:hypothetical protein
MTEGYNRLELLCAIESVMKIGYRAKRSQNFCGNLKEISATLEGPRIWSRLGRFIYIQDTNASTLMLAYVSED